MFRIGKPSPDTVERFRQALAERDYSYAEVGLSRFGEAPQGNFVNRWRQVLGQGEEFFTKAREALANWQMFDIGWAYIDAEPGPPETNQNVAIYAGKAGVWALVGCRVVYVVDETDCPVVRYGFANGTLVDHVVSGEERFLVEWNRETDEVTYDLYSFSWPSHFVSQCGYPVLWRLQQRFARDSAEALITACGRKSNQPAEPVR